jgi:phosphatidylserine/phosphatidylglycerophosphate/cardiolipin synthase-like enzyme
MLSLDELRDRWFLDVDDPTGFPSQSRHPGALVHPYTDGNRVTPILNGADFMARAHELIRAMIDSEDPSAHQLWIHAWRIEPVKVLGETADGPDAESLLEEAALAGVQVRFLASGHDFHAEEVAKRIIAAGGEGARDKRTSTFGSHHQKFIVFRFPGDDWRATLGSGDFLHARWDTHACDPVEPNRSSKGAPTHDVWLEIDGPAVHDVALHFAERWNDATSSQRTAPKLSSTLPIGFKDEAIAPVGPHSLQLLRTYPVLKSGGFTWSKQGEFTIWAAYLNAIRQAKRYIYLEDQYFYSFQDPPLSGRPSDPLYAQDIVVQLGEAIKRGVDVLVTVPSRKGDWRKHYELQQRGKAFQYLADCSSKSGAGRAIGCFLRKGEMDPIIHSKLMLVDDEYAIVGSANIGQRSMSYDSEVSFGVVDAEGQLVRELRTDIWAKHMEHADPRELDDITDAIDAFESSARNESGRLRMLPPNLVRFPFPYRWIMNGIIDPYGGPNKIPQSRSIRESKQ